MSESAKILVVDDIESNIDILLEIFGDQYTVSVATDGPTALEVAKSDMPDIILLDVMMPGMDGYEVCEHLKKDAATAKIPVIFVTAMSETEDEETGFRLGAVDYLVKPITPVIAKARVETHLALKSARDALENQNEILEEKVRQRTRELQRTQDVTIQGLASLAETRDNETGMHIRRTQNYVKILAVELRKQGHHTDILTEEFIDFLFKSAPLHDIGKVGIPDAILLKPGKLTDEEFDIMRTHAILGYEALESAEGSEGSTTFLALAKEVALSHHEKWNGRGYPNGLKGEAIPLSGRLMAIADVYDALISKRVYKPPFTHEKSVGIITEDSGQGFDSDVVAAFQAAADQFLETAREFADDDEQRKALG